MKLLCKILLPIFLFCTPAFAADKHCGRDTDRNGTVDAWCPGSDEDWDGYSAGVDCNDHAFFTHPGTWVKDGSNVKLCQSNGMYGAPVLLNSITCTSGGAPKYFAAIGGSTSVGCGSEAMPCDYRCFQFGNGLACSISLPAGSCVVQRGGTYSLFYTESGTKHQFYQLLRNGTPTAKITWMSAPGEAVIWNGPGTAGSAGTPIALASTSHFIVGGNDVPMEVIGNFGEQGLMNEDSSNNEFHDFIVRDTDGGTGGNISGVRNQGGGNQNNLFRHFFSYGNYMRSDPTNQNNTQIVDFRGNNWAMKYFSAWSTFAGGDGIVFKLKHQEDTPGLVSWEVTGGAMFDSRGPCMEIMGGGGNIHHNFFKDCAKDGTHAISWAGGSGATYFKDNTLFTKNTVIGPAPLQVYTNESNENSSVFGSITIEENVFVKTVGGSSFIDVCSNTSHCEDTFYDNVIGGGKVIIRRNLEWNNGLAQNYNVFSSSHSGAAGRGASYSTCAAWQAAGWNNGGYCQNPVLDSAFRCTATNCLLWGWLPGNAAGGGGGEDPPPDPPPDPGPEIIGSGKLRLLMRRK